MMVEKDRGWSYLGTIECTVCRIQFPFLTKFIQTLWQLLHNVQNTEFTNTTAKINKIHTSIVLCTRIAHTYINEIRHPFTDTRLTALCPGLPGWAGTRKVKPTWILLKQETVSGSEIRWAICKSAPCSRQITMPAPHRSDSHGKKSAKSQKLIWKIGKITAFSVHIFYCLQSHYLAAPWIHISIRVV